MRAMADLVEHGKIRLVGVSNYSAARTRQCGDLLQQRGVRLAANQVKYSLLAGFKGSSQHVLAGVRVAVR